MSRSSWMLYGATGTSGTHIAEEAVRRGHHPLLAGRSSEKLASLAHRLDLEWIVLDLADVSALSRAIADVDLVLLAAGPFGDTSMPVQQACLTGHTHYIDIAGEIGVFQHTYSRDKDAKESGIALLSGAGFGVIPTDCLVKYVVDQLPDALEVAVGSIIAYHHRSAGALASSQAVIRGGGFIRRNGQMVPFPLGEGSISVRFPDGEHMMMPAPLADLEAAYRTTGIPNITAYIPVPGTEYPMNEHSYVWARATNSMGRIVQAWLETSQGYEVTAAGAILCVEQVLATHPIGAITPASAFGSDLILHIQGTTRYDTVGEA